MDAPCWEMLPDFHLVFPRAPELLTLLQMLIYDKLRTLSAKTGEMGMNRVLLLVSLMLVGVAEGQVDLQLTQVANVTSVVEIKAPFDGSDRLFLLQQTGAIRVLENGQLLEPWTFAP
jgi:hypothetical protein